jgi:hypothetical protein
MIGVVADQRVGFFDDRPKLLYFIYRDGGVFVFFTVVYCCDGDVEISWVVGVDFLENILSFEVEDNVSHGGDCIIVDYLAEKENARRWCGEAEFTG